ncbi:MAG: ABC transporter ATP-binding protein [Acidimicrobiia bacterium]|nr:ABC transporter ATP-binding protein [Acidimicrobiia bacterium]
MSAVIQVKDLSKQFTLRHDASLKERVVNRIRGANTDETFWALRNLSFDLEQGKTLSLIGPNGSGKSTLLKIIGGIIEPTEGWVARRGRLAALLELGAGFHPDLTGRENVYVNASILGLSNRQIDKYFDDIIEFSEIEKFIDNQVKFYSSGMYVRLAFSVAVHVEPEILLIDEVLAVGDEPFQQKCMERIKTFQDEGRTLVFVTHSLDILRQFCDEAILLDQGNVLAHGPPSEVVSEFRERFLPHLEEEEDEFGTREVEIKGLRVLDGDGVERDKFSPGDDVVLEITYDAHETIADPVFGIAILNQVDALVYGTNTDFQGISVARVHGEGIARFTFPSIPIVDGRYYVTVAVHSRDGEVQYHRIERLGQFRVVSGAEHAGFLHLEPTIDIVDRESSG